MSRNKNIILGYSGHGYVVADAALKSGISIKYYAEKDEVQKNPFELEYIGYEGSSRFEGWNQGYGFVLGVGDNKIRIKLGQLILKKKEQLLTIIHSSAEISKTATIGAGTFVSAHTSINALSTIGRYVILNTNCVIEHECLIAEGAHIAPGAVLAGNVSVGRGSFVGANAVVKEGVIIGDEVTVGAGATIIEDIPSGNKVVGNPGRKI